MLPEMYVQARSSILQFISSSTCFLDLELVSSYQVVEIIDRYDTDCIPVANRTDKDLKIQYIQSSVEKTCNRSLRVCVFVMLIMCYVLC